MINNIEWLQAPAKTIKLSNQQTMELINLYKQHPFLWDVGHENYNNKQIRKEVLNKFSVNNCKQLFTGKY